MFRYLVCNQREITHSSSKELSIRKNFIDKRTISYVLNYYKFSSVYLQNMLYLKEIKSDFQAQGK